MIRFNFSIDKKSRKIINKLDRIMFDAFVEGFEDAMKIAEEAVEDNTPVRTGRLKASIQSGTNISERRMYGWVGSNVIYAGIQEEGGVIRAKSGEFLKFNAGGRTIYVRQVRIPAQHFIENALVGRLDEITNAIEDVVTRTVNMGG